MCHRFPIVAAVLGGALLGCATAPVSDTLSISLKYPDGHPEFVSAYLLVSRSPLDLDSLPTSTANELRVEFYTSGRFADVLPNACYRLTTRAGQVSVGFARLSYTGSRIAGPLEQWIDGGHSIELNMDERDGVMGRTVIGFDRVLETSVTGAATRIRNLDACIQMVRQSGT